MLELKRPDLQHPLLPDQRPLDVASPHLDLPVPGFLFEQVGGSNSCLPGREVDRLRTHLVAQFLAFIEKFSIHPFNGIIVEFIILNGLRREKGH